MGKIDRSKVLKMNERHIKREHELVWGAAKELKQILPYNARQGKTKKDLRSNTTRKQMTIQGKSRKKV